MRKDRDIYFKPDPDAGKRKKTAGEHVFKEITYRGVDFALNATFGVSFTYFVARTKTGQNWFGKPVYNFFENAFKPVLKDPKNLKIGASAGRDFLSIMMGGTAIIPFIMALETNKQKIVQSIDKKIYGEEEVENNPRFSIAYHDIDHEPQKGFATGMAARFIALAPLFYAEVKHHDACEKFLHIPVGTFSKFMAGKLGIKGTGLKANKYMDSAGRTIDQAGNELNDWNFIHNTIGMDFGLTFFYSFMHEWSYKGLSQLMHTPKDRAEAQTAEQTPEKTIDAATAHSANNMLKAEPPSIARAT